MVSILLSDQNFLGNKSSFKLALYKIFSAAKKSLFARISLKIHFFHFHLGFLPFQHWERFHQKIQQVEDHYQGRINRLWC